MGVLLGGGVALRALGVSPVDGGCGAVRSGGVKLEALSVEDEDAAAGVGGGSRLDRRGLELEGGASPSLCEVDVIERVSGAEEEEEGE